MREWKFWDWTGYGALGGAALFLALKEGVDRLPPARVPQVLTDPIFAFLPLILFLIGSVILILRGLGWIGSSKAPANAPNTYQQPIAEPAAKPLKPVAEERERVFVGESVTPEYLISIFKEHTNVQGARLIQPYIGKWMKITGSLSNVLSSSPDRAQVTFAHPDVPFEQRTWFHHCTVYMYFRGAWVERVSILQRGDKLTVIGQIEDVNGVEMHLNNCELAPAARSA